MRLPPSDRPPVRWWQLGLAACALGAVLTPIGYLVLGAPAGFPPLFSLVMSPAVMASVAYVLYRALRAPDDRRRNNGAAIAAGMALMLALIVIAVFLLIVSGFTLLRLYERLGIFACLFLLCSVFGLGLLRWRRGCLLHRVARRPATVAIPLLIVVVGVAVAVAVNYLVRAPAFL